MVRYGVRYMARYRAKIFYRGWRGIRWSDGGDYTDAGAIGRFMVRKSLVYAWPSDCAAVVMMNTEQQEVMGWSW
jgi:hypothetical protein